MASTRVVIRAATLAVIVSIAVPTVAQGLPRFFVNGVAAKTAQPFVMYGAITMHNGTLGNIECQTLNRGNVRNEQTEGTEKGLASFTQFSSGECKAETPCRVKNTKGEEVEGIFLTAETPPIVEGAETHLRGISSLPWTGELIEREAGGRQLLIHHLKHWVVFPPNTAGKGVGCIGTEIEFEDQEGATEKEEGYDLAPLWIDGAKNGMHPSHMELLGETTEKCGTKLCPETGRLRSPQVGDAFYVAKSLTPIGPKIELITAE